MLVFSFLIHWSVILMHFKFILAVAHIQCALTGASSIGVPQADALCQAAEESVKLDFLKLREALEEEGIWDETDGMRMSVSDEVIDGTIEFLKGLREDQRDMLARFDPRYDLLSYSIGHAIFHLYVALVLGTPIDPKLLAEADNLDWYLLHTLSHNIFAALIKPCVRQHCDPLIDALALSDLAQVMFLRLGSGLCYSDDQYLLAARRMSIRPPEATHPCDSSRFDSIRRLSIRSLLLELKFVDLNLNPPGPGESVKTTIRRRMGYLLTDPFHHMSMWESEVFKHQLANDPTTPLEPLIKAPPAAAPVGAIPISPHTSGSESTAASEVRSPDLVPSRDSVDEAAGLQDQMRTYAHDCMRGSRDRCAALSSTIRQSKFAMAVFLKRVVGEMNRTVGKALLRSLIDSRWIFTRSLLTKRKHARLLSMPLGDIQGGLPAWSGEQSIKEVLRSSLHSLPKRYPPTEGRVPE